MNHANHGYVVAHCEWQSIYLMFGAMGSVLMNAVVAREVYTLLSKTKNLEDYAPPKTRTVAKQAACVYLISAFCASWTLWGVIPHKANAMGGMGCMPMEYSLESSLFFWLVFIGLSFGLPSLYISSVFFRVQRGGMLLSESSKRSSSVVPAGGTAPSRERARAARTLTLYFRRISVVYYVLWVPAIFLIYVLDMHHVWIGFVGGSWAHLQGIVSAAMTLTKPDIRHAVLGLFKCCTPREGPRAPKLITRVSQGALIISEDEDIVRPPEKKAAPVATTELASSSSTTHSTSFICEFPSEGTRKG